MSIPYSVKWETTIPRAPRGETIRLTSAAGVQWMREAMKSRELIRREGGLFAVMHINEFSSGRVTADLLEVFLVEEPKRPEIPSPGFYY